MLQLNKSLFFSKFIHVAKVIKVLQSVLDAIVETMNYLELVRIQTN